MGFGGGHGVVVVTNIGDHEHCGVQTASLHLLSCRASLGTTTSIISPTNFKRYQPSVDSIKLVVNNQQQKHPYKRC